MNRITLARVLAVAAAGTSIAVMVIAGALTPDYSHVSRYISELGANGMPWGDVVSIAGFIPVGVLIALFLIVAAPVVPLSGASRVGYFLLFSQSIAYIVAGLAPCDYGCPAEGSLTQGIHNLIGLLTYLLAAAGIFMLSTAPTLGTRGRTGFVIAGIIWLSAFLLMANPELAHLRGLFQRIAEAVLWAVILFIAFGMSNAKAGRTNAQFMPST